MLIDNSEIIRHFDFLIYDIKDADTFSIKHTLIDNNRIAINTEKEKEYFFILVDSLKNFGQRNEYIETLQGDSNSWFSLTKKGLQLKESKKGHLKFIKSLQKQKMTLFEKISISFVIISGIYGFWQQNQNDDLKTDYKSLNNQYDSLKTVSDFYKFRIDSFLILRDTSNLDKGKQ